MRVDEIMAKAGLTHGGFYAHFSSKDDLIQEALALASGETIETLSQRFDTISADRRIQAVIDVYLNPGHARHPDRGCPLAALGAELARLQGKPRRELARGVKERVEWLRGLLRRRPGAALDQQAIGALACMVGGMVLARAVGGHESTTILAACRAFLHRALDEASARPHRPRPRK